MLFLSRVPALLCACDICHGRSDSDERDARCGAVSSVKDGWEYIKRITTGKEMVVGIDRMADGVI